MLPHIPRACGIFRRRSGELRRVGKAKRAHHRAVRELMDGGHVASLLCPPYEPATTRGPFRCQNLSPPSLRGAKRRSNPRLSKRIDGLLRFARNDGERASLRRQNRPLDLAKTDAVAVALAPAAHDERIAVFKERALDAGSEFDRLGAVPAYL